MKKLLGLGIAIAMVALPALGCETITTATVKLSGCVDDTMWVKQEATAPAEFLYYSGDQAMAFQIIAEPDTYPTADFRAAILANAEAAAGSKEGVSVAGERIENVGGKPWNLIEYKVTAEGATFTFQNFYFTAPGFGSTQVVFWSDPSYATAAAYRAGQLMATLTVQ